MNPWLALNDSIVTLTPPTHFTVDTRRLLSGRAYVSRRNGSLPNDPPADLNRLPRHCARCAIRLHRSLWPAVKWPRLWPWR